MRRSAFLFPGLGSQQLGMLEQLPEFSRIVQYLDAAEAITGVPLAQIAQYGPLEALEDPLIASPLIYLSSYAWGTQLRRYGVKPHVVAGYSLGEFAALAVADVFSVGAGLQLVIARARAITRAVQDTDGATFAVTGLDLPRVREVITAEPNLWVGFDNAERHIVLSGAVTSLEAVTPLLYATGAARVIPLQGAGALHCPWMSQASVQVSTLLEQAEFRDASVPVIPNATALPTRDGEELRQALIDQLTHTVRWREITAEVVDQQVDFVIEAGPGSILTGMGLSGDGGPARIALSQVGIEATAERVFRRPGTT